MAKSKLTWAFYSARRNGLTVEKYCETNGIKSLEELQKNLKQKGVELPPAELTKNMFKPEWTGVYPQKSNTEKPRAKKETPPKRKSNVKSTQKRRKSKKSEPAEKKSTYLQAAYETGEQGESDADSGA